VSTLSWPASAVVCRKNGSYPLQLQPGLLLYSTAPTTGYSTTSPAP
jgi:hypothetical protein